MSWILRNFKLDKSIDITLRSLNNMCFSNQFYFVSSLFAYGIFAMVFGLSAIIKHNYIVFSDKLVLIFYGLFGVVFYIINFILGRIWSKVNFWTVFKDKP